MRFTFTVRTAAVLVLPTMPLTPPPPSVGTGAGLRQVSRQDLMVVFQVLDSMDEIGFGDVVDFRAQGELDIVRSRIRHLPKNPGLLRPRGADGTRRAAGVGQGPADAPGHLADDGDRAPRRPARSGMPAPQLPASMMTAFTWVQSSTASGPMERPKPLFL